MALSAGCRAAKSGINRDMQAKISAKYDPQLAGECLQWIKDTINCNCSDQVDFCTDGDQDNFQAVLKSGWHLARFINVLSPGLPAGLLAREQTMAFKQMDLIGKFLKKVEEYGIPDYERFQTVDLFERQNLHQVVICLQALGRKSKAFGPKEAAENRRHFTDDQLKAGQNVISLQMGTNKGASQAGQNFGKQRMILD